MSKSVCLSLRISLLPMAVARSSCSRVTKSQGEEAILGVSSPLRMHCTALPKMSGVCWIAQRVQSLISIGLPCCHLQHVVSMSLCCICYSHVGEASV